VNLINRMPPDRFRHAIICLTTYTDFRHRIKRPDVAIHALDKPAGNSPATLFRLWRLLRTLRPAILHTRNLAALEGAVPAALAGIRARIHGEHGRDINDIDGSNVRQQRIRRLFKPFVSQYIALSKDLESYLCDKIHVPRARVAQLYNGVDTELFHPGRYRARAVAAAGLRHRRRIRHRHDRPDAAGQGPADARARVRAALEDGAAASGEVAAGDDRRRPAARPGRGDPRRGRLGGQGTGLAAR
jgi:glycosyltransferase involved in cell wall biosynthesis